MPSSVITFKLRKVKSLTGTTEDYYIFCDCVFHCDWSSISVFQCPEAGSAAIFKLDTFVMKLICIFKCTQLTKIKWIVFL